MTAHPLTSDPEDGDAVVRRLAPPDRRKPIHVPRGECPVGASCGCCPGPAGLGHYIPGENGQKSRLITNCQMSHPDTARACRPPYPSKIPPCREQATLPQFPPGPPCAAACVECGRMTGRRWTDPEGRSLPWCGGLFPQPKEEPDGSHQ